jgi:uncharacterized protein (DUF302 family)
MFNVDYGFTRTLPNTKLEEARARITSALAEQGFGVLTEIDVKATLKNKLDVDFRPYVILGACNPPIAHEALQAEPGIGLILPCNVVVAEDDAGGAVISVIKPEAMFSLVNREVLAPLVDRVTKKLTAALEAA